MGFGIEVTNGRSVVGTEIKDFLFTSQAVSVKNVIFGGGSILPTLYTNPLNGSIFYEASVVIPHNLGYEPVVFVYFRPGNADAGASGGIYPWINDTNDPLSWSFIDNFICSVLTDKKNLTLQFRDGQAGIPFDYRYFILVERSV